MYLFRLLVRCVFGFEEAPNLWVSCFPWSQRLSEGKAIATQRGGFRVTGEPRGATKKAFFYICKRSNIAWFPPLKTNKATPWQGRQVFNKTISQEKCSKPGLRHQTDTLRFGFVRTGVLCAQPEVTPTPKPEVPPDITKQRTLMKAFQVRTVRLNSTLRLRTTHTFHQDTVQLLYETPTSITLNTFVEWLSHV